MVTTDTKPTTGTGTRKAKASAGKGPYARTTPSSPGKSHIPKKSPANKKSTSPSQLSPLAPAFEFHPPATTTTTSASVKVPPPATGIRTPSREGRVPLQNDQQQFPALPSSTPAAPATTEPPPLANIPLPTETISYAKVADPDVETETLIEDKEKTGEKSVLGEEKPALSESVEEGAVGKVEEKDIAQPPVLKEAAKEKDEQIALVAAEVAESIAPIQAKEESSSEIASEVAQVAAPIQKEEEERADVASEVAESAASLQETVQGVREEQEEVQEKVPAIDISGKVATPSESPAPPPTAPKVPEPTSIPTQETKVAEVAAEVAEVVAPIQAQEEEQGEVAADVAQSAETVQEKDEEVVFVQSKIEEPPAGKSSPLEESIPVEQPSVPTSTLTIADDLIPTSAETALSHLNTSHPDLPEVISPPAVASLDGADSSVPIIPPTPSVDVDTIPTSAEEVAALPTLEEVLDLEPESVDVTLPDSDRKIEEQETGKDATEGGDGPSSDPLSAAPTTATPFTDSILSTLSQPRPLSTQPTPPTLRRRSSSSSSRSSQRGDVVKAAPEAPSLTLALVAAWKSTTWKQRIPAILASVAINFGLPFINGVMLGFGELFARNVIGVRLGWVAPFTGAAPALSRANTASRSQGFAPPGERKSAGLRTAGDAIVQEGEVLAGLQAAAK
ncbi:hypothetical protein T439DRAFT_321520 [Meredithblackwellia eburnea MCA 4105]